MFDGARRVVGIDISKEAIINAKQNFPGCSFFEQSWDDLPSDEKFDVILCSSAMHYAQDQELLIHLLAEKLTQNGVLILEVGVAPGNGAEWVKVQRSIDTRIFPTRNKINSILSRYAYKYMGESSEQIGDPVPRAVFHVRRKKPYAFLLMEGPGAGKTTIRNSFFHEQKIVSGDALVLNIASGKLKSNAKLYESLSSGVNPARIDVAVRSIFSAGLWEKYLEVVLVVSNGESFVYDGYIPAIYHELVLDFFKASGYFPVNLCWENPYALQDLGSRVKAEARKYSLYLAAVRNKLRR